ncbi:hypothetical protein Btru_041280 [Bulinus truncatus]|nr:hypothetical protein Btru_041280 [Bulinus truncatus]
MAGAIQYRSHDRSYANFSFGVRGGDSRTMVRTDSDKIFNCLIVNGSSPQQRLMGLMVTATALDKKGVPFVPGIFNTSADIRVQDLKEDKTCEKSVIAHRYLVNKNGASFQWTAPVQGTGCIHFKVVITRAEIKTGGAGLPINSFSSPPTTLLKPGQNVLYSQR